MKVAQLWLTLCKPMDCPWNSLGKNTGVGSLSLLQGIFPTKKSNLGLLHCRQILYQLSYKGSPRIMAWVAYPFSRGSSRPGNQMGIIPTQEIWGSPALQVDSLPTELSAKAYMQSSVQFSHSVMSDSLRPHELQHARPPCLSLTPRVYSNSCPSSW